MQNFENIVFKYLKWAPVSLTLREVSRIHSLKLLDEKLNLLKAKTILDVGCGDGRWWLNILPNELDKIHGIDISSKEIDLAKQLIWARCVDITEPNFSELIDGKKFDLIIGNCSMEHIYQIDKALKNIHSVLNEGGTFLLFVPTPYWALKGKSISMLHKISPRLSMMFSGMINGFFQHWHLYHYKIWTSLLINFGFKDIQSFGLGNKHTEFLFRLFLPSAFLSFCFKIITGKYLNFFLGFIIPDFLIRRMSKYITQKLDKDLLPANADNIFEYILVCRK